MTKLSSRLIWVIFLISVLIMAYSLGSFAAEFSADISITENKKTTTGKIYASNDKFRQEMSGSDGTAVTIIRLDKKVMWTLLDDNTYMEISGEAVMDPSAPKAPDYEVVNLGSEVVNGYTCDKIQYIYKDKSLGSMIQWVVPDLQYAVRTEMTDRKGKVTSVIDITNVRPGPQPATLFEIPPGYSKFELPIKLPFGLFGK